MSEGKQHLLRKVPTYAEKAAMYDKIKGILDKDKSSNVEIKMGKDGELKVYKTRKRCELTL